MGRPRPLFEFIYCWTFCSIDYNKWWTIIGHFCATLMRHVFTSGTSQQREGVLGRCALCSVPIDYLQDWCIIMVSTKTPIFYPRLIFARILIFLTNNFDLCFANDSRRGITMTSFLPWHGFWQLDLAAVKTVSNRYLVNFIEVGLASNSECVDRTAESRTVFKELQSIVSLEVKVANFLQGCEILRLNLLQRKARNRNARETRTHHL